MGDDPEDQKWWIEKRAETQATRDEAASDGENGGLSS